VTDANAHRAIEAVFRIESPAWRGWCATWASLAQDALVTALERWPEAGVPDKPGAWADPR
jgi:predicted RNA polymerase sigma factor